MNPRNSQQAHLAEDQSLNQCNAVHTLRSEKKVDNQVIKSSNPIQHNHTKASTSSSPNPSNSYESETDKSTSQVHKPIVPFPNRLKNNKQNPHMDKIIEIFNQVKINVSLLDAIQSQTAQSHSRITSSSLNPFKSDESETDKLTSQVYKPIVPFPNRLRTTSRIHTWIK